MATRDKTWEFTSKISLREASPYTASAPRPTAWYVQVGAPPLHPNRCCCSPTSIATNTGIRTWCVATGSCTLTPAHNRSAVAQSSCARCGSTPGSPAPPHHPQLPRASCGPPCSTSPSRLPPPPCIPGSLLPSPPPPPKPPRLPVDNRCRCWVIIGVTVSIHPCSPCSRRGGPQKHKWPAGYFPEKEEKEKREGK